MVSSDPRAPDDCRPRGPCRRRAFLAGLGAAVATSTVAGCLSGGAGGGPGESEDEPVVDEAETTEGTTDRDAWIDVERLRFDGWVGGWVGVEPSAIDRVENPMLVLVEGREYELTWENMDGIHHNVAFWNEDWEVVADYSTPGNDVVGETETLVFEATAEIDTYRCEYQPVGQKGEVRIIDS
ncbi:hypothetical protein [Natronobacterium haloterrestre]|nr:hypothetical protein [Halobiforma haloterrestris]